MLKFTRSCIEDSLTLFAYYKRLAERAMEQVSDEELYTALDEDGNSIAIIVKHMAGNMRSRWSDFLHSDGEKPTRNRDGEFEDPPATRQTLMDAWEEGWATLLGTLESLSEADLGLTVTIRGEAHSVVQAINRQMAHYPYHVGQIVMLARHLAHNPWESLSIPRRRSGEFNQKVASGELSQR